MSKHTFVRRLTIASLAGVLSTVLCTSPAAAQAPAQPPAPPAPAPAPSDAPADQGNWVGSVGGGVALTAGNSDTLTLNLAFDARRDPHTRNVMRWTGLYLRGEQNDIVVANRLSLSFRDQFSFTQRAFLYGQVDYLRDTFKAIDALVATTAGLGVKVVDAPTTRFVLNGGVGAVREKNPGVPGNTSAALTAAEEFYHQLTETSFITHSATGLWKVDDLNDALATVSVGIATKITDMVQLSVDVLDVYKRRPPTANLNKHDIVLVTAVTAKF